MIESEIWILIIASLVAISCASIGVFLVLRKMSMLGDAISHSVLFGIAAAFLLTSSRSTAVMLIGAGAVGLLTAYLASALNRYGKLQEDASIGVTFTWLFALGVILISAFADRVDLDQECVLYGEIAFAPLDTIEILGKDAGPRAVWMLGFVTLANLIFILMGYRNLKAISFDPVLASSLGINVALWHYLLMSFVSLTTVASFESVGAILVVAMLVVPANTAYLFARSLVGMLSWAIFLALLSAVTGFFLASYFEASISAAMAMMSGVFFVIALLSYHLKALKSVRPMSFPSAVR
ncbi:MAG: metal ABC transporter permease [Deltaproteobacteria bacterium]|nr:metal ABC transporter permease [Deltaproteobacteria bacterium]